MLPAAFSAQMQALLGKELPDFETALQQPPPVSVRLNSAKKPLVQSLDLSESVCWCSEGYYLPQRPVFTLDPLFHAGAYYVQEASSMLIEQAVRQTVNLNQPVRVLDLCAAPGGKSTLLANVLHPDSLLICNEIIRSRVNILKENLQKWGLPNVQVSHHDPQEFSALTGFFDLILVDAPCSGEGLFRKDAAAAGEWSPESVLLCAARQKRILAAVVPLLKPNGILIYCTCTYNQTENQANADFMVEQLQCQELPLELPNAWGVRQQRRGYQCYPHLVRGEGFFLSVFKKKGGVEFNSSVYAFRSMKELHHKDVRLVVDWLAEPDEFDFFMKPNQEIIAVLAAQTDDLKIIDRALSAKGLGLEMGVIKGKDFIPDHALALSVALAPAVQRVEVSAQTALQFLKKENVILADAPKGWLLLTHQGLGLGWAKNLGNRVNNYLPKEWRIRMELPE